MYWHWQNLNDNGSAFKHGRAWWHFGGRFTFNPEWTFGSAAHSTGVGLKFGGDDRTVMLSFGLAYLFSLYLSFDGMWPRRWAFGKYGEQEREFRVYWFEGTLNLNLAYDWTEGSYNGKYRDIWIQPGSRHWSWCPKDFFLGRARYEDRTIEEVPVRIPMPEKVYDGTCRVFESTWTRPRWPWFPIRMRRTEVSIPGGIPFPGKGENSWDCGEDACFGLTSAAKTPNAAVGEVVKSVLRDRERHGGRNWQPSEKVSA